MSRTVQQCADEVQKPEVEKKFKKKFKYFAIQFYGECWAGDESVSKTYFIDGTSKNCYEGTGGSYTNYVYHFGAEKGMFLVNRFSNQSVCFETFWKAVSSFINIIILTLVSTSALQKSKVKSRRPFIYWFKSPKLPWIPNWRGFCIGKGLEDLSCNYLIK